MNVSDWLVATLFLPLFPMSMLFNSLYQRLPHPLLQLLLVLVWPVVGLWLVKDSVTEIPHWLVGWSVASALLYGFRQIVVKDIRVWTGFMATSCWSLLWPAIILGIDARTLLVISLAFSLPIGLFTILTAEIVTRYQTAFAGVVKGVAANQPRLAGLLVICLLALIASPPFPAFFAMLHLTVETVSNQVVVLGLMACWLFWSWSGIRLLQSLLVGQGSKVPADDLSFVRLLIYSLMVVILLIAGFLVSGGLT